jgi:hypothetical protein
MTDSRYGDATPAFYRGGLPIGADTIHTCWVSLTECYLLSAGMKYVSTNIPCPPPQITQFILFSPLLQNMDSEKIVLDSALVSACLRIAVLWILKDNLSTAIREDRSE